MIDNNKLTREINAVLTPRAALIAYESEEDDCFLELREIDSHGNMGEGRPVTVEFMNRLVREYSERHGNTPYGRIPRNLLFCDTRKGSERYVWYNPPGKRMMFFTKNLNIESAEYHHPGIVYEVKGNSLGIYAYKDEALAEDTLLHAAPFFNVTHSSVCLGNADIKMPGDLTYESLLDYWEKKFWLTEFSHLGGGGNPTKSNLVLVTKAARQTPFNSEELIPLKTKLKDLLK